MYFYPTVLKKHMDLEYKWFEKTFEKKWNISMKTPMERQLVKKKPKTSLSAIFNILGP